MREDNSRTRRSLRLGSPAGLILAGFCLLLPFLTASCSSEEAPRAQWRLSYTGIDVLTGGRPDVELTDDADKEPMRRLDDAEVEEFLGAPPASLPTLPLAWPAAALLLAALAATALPSRTWRTTATGGLALAAAVVLAGATVLARNDATGVVASVMSGVFSERIERPALREGAVYGEVSDMFRYGWGLWITLALVAAVGVANTVAAVRRPAPVAGEPDSTPVA
ncbi:hypothetical protein AB0J83_02250 [Actinoplanes sp. NPDC049596]|uniref:hypothetical protein n=1 Tax=unclassified Actinoplanes TaxID=2626549 RepID=UPI0034293B1C